MASLVHGTGTSVLPRRRKTARERRCQQDRAEGRRFLHLLRTLESINNHRGSGLGTVGAAVLQALQAARDSAEPRDVARGEGVSKGASGDDSVAPVVATSLAASVVPEDFELDERVGRGMEVDRGVGCAGLGVGSVSTASKDAGAVDEEFPSGVLAVFRNLRAEQGGEKAVADVSAWVAAKRARLRTQPPLAASGLDLAEALAESEAPAVAKVKSVLKRMREKDEEAYVDEFIKWVSQARE